MSEISEKEIEAAARALRPDAFRELTPMDLRSDDYALTNRQRAQEAARRSAQAALARAEANAGEPVAWECEGERPGEWKEPRHIIYDPELAQQRMESPWWNVRPLVYAHPAPEPSGPVEFSGNWLKRQDGDKCYVSLCRDDGKSILTVEVSKPHWSDADTNAAADTILSALTAGTRREAVASGPCPHNCEEGGICLANLSGYPESCPQTLSRDYLRGQIGEILCLELDADENSKSTSRAVERILALLGVAAA